MSTLLLPGTADSDKPCGRLTIPFRPLGDRVVIKADLDDRAPVQTESGLVTAKTLAAAVEGTDQAESWFVGTVIALGPLVNKLELRPFVLRKLRELEQYKFVKHEEICALRFAIEDVPTETPECVHLWDRVCFSWTAGQEVIVNGEKYLMLKASDVLAVLDESEAA